MEEDLPHVQTTKYHWRDMVYQDHANAALLGTCNGRNPREWIPQPLEIEISMVWDRMDLVKEIYPAMLDWRNWILDAFVASAEVRYSQILPLTPFRYRHIVDKRCSEEDPFMDDDQPDMLAAVHDAEIAKAEYKRRNSRHEEDKDEVKIGSPKVRRMDARRPPNLEIPPRSPPPLSKRSRTLLETPKPRTPPRMTSPPKVRRVVETPRSQLPKAQSPGRLLWYLDENGFDVREKQKREAELADLKDRGGYKSNLNPASKRRTGTREIPIAVYEEESEDTEASEDSFETWGDWCLDLPESLQHKHEVRKLMDKEHSLMEKCRLQREYCSISRHIRELKRAISV